MDSGSNLDERTSETMGTLVYKFLWELGRRTKDRGQRSEVRGQGAGQKTEDRGRRTGSRTEDRGRRTEDKEQRAEVGIE